MENFKKSFVNIFKDNDGKVVIIQKPNLPLYIALGSYLIRFIDDDQSVFYLSHLGVAIVMLYWSYLEIVSGVNIWRRILGIVVGLYILVSRIFFPIP